jgi:ferredoxin
MTNVSETPVAVARYRVAVDHSRCQGHARCIALASDLFDLDDEGRGVPLKEYVEGSEVQTLLLAVAGCPEQAISASPADGEGGTT